MRLPVATADSGTASMARRAVWVPGKKSPGSLGTRDAAAAEGWSRCVSPTQRRNAAEARPGSTAARQRGQVLAAGIAGLGGAELATAPGAGSDPVAERRVPHQRPGASRPAANMARSAVPVHRPWARPGCHRRSAKAACRLRAPRPPMPQVRLWRWAGAITAAAGAAQQVPQQVPQQLCCRNRRRNRRRNRCRNRCCDRRRRRCRCGGRRRPGRARIITVNSPSPGRARLARGRRKSPPCAASRPAPGVAGLAGQHRPGPSSQAWHICHRERTVWPGSSTAPAALWSFGVAAITARSRGALHRAALALQRQGAVAAQRDAGGAPPAAPSRTGGWPGRGRAAGGIHAAEVGQHGHQLPVLAAIRVLSMNRPTSSSMRGKSTAPPGRNTACCRSRRTGIGCGGRRSSFRTSGLSSKNTKPPAWCAPARGGLRRLMGLARRGQHAASAGSPSRRTTVGDALPLPVARQADEAAGGAAPQRAAGSWARSRTACRSPARGSARSRAWRHRRASSTSPASRRHRSRSNRCPRH